MLSRRSFLSRSGLAAATAGLASAPHLARSADELLTKPGQKPRKIIHLVSDGMSLGTLSCADQFAYVMRGKGLAWMQLYANPNVRQGLMNTRSLNSLVTDSAAASSAWGSGSRVTNGALNVLPDGRLLTPLYTLLGEKGWARGLVTTAEITHATPAGFAAATRSRDNAQSIALQYLERKIEVLLGGGKPFFDPAKRKDQRDLRGDFAKAGYAVVNDLTGLLAAPSDKFLLGTFADSHLPYTVDHLADPKLHSTMPTLAQMTRAALDRLDRHEQFMLQVEGARIDHAAHNSDAAGAIRDQMALDDALEVCLEYQAKNPDTLLVVTTDHGNSNLGLNGMGGGYRQSSRRFAALAEVKASYSEILKRLTKAGEKIKVPPIPNDAQDKMDVPDPMAKLVSSSGDKDENDEPKLTAAEQLVSALWVNPAIIQQIVGDATGYQMSQRRAMLFSRVLAGDYQALYDQMNSPVSQLGQLMANRLGIGWTGNTHTADYVPILAVGPGSERFAGFQENVDLFRHYTALAEVDYRNPSLPLIAANDHDGPEAHDVERPGRYAGLDVRMIG